MDFVDAVEALCNPPESHVHVPDICERRSEDHERERSMQLALIVVFRASFADIGDMNMGLRKTTIKKGRNAWIRDASLLDVCLPGEGNDDGDVFTVADSPRQPSESVGSVCPWRPHQAARPSLLPQGA